MSNAWFCYIGGTPSVPNSYRLMTPQFGCTCVGSESLCAIYAALSTSSAPILTTTLLAAISQAVEGSPSAKAINKDV